MKQRLCLVFMLLLVAHSVSVSAQSDSISNLPDIENLYKVDEGVYRSGQPNKEEFKQLEQFGIKEILNMRRHNSDDNKARGTDLKLHRIKVRAEAIKEKHLLEAMKIIKNRNGSILIHCHHGSDRTGAVVAMYRIIFQNWTKEQAIDEMKNGGYGFHSIFRNIPKLIENIDIEAFKEKLYAESGYVKI